MSVECLPTDDGFELVFSTGDIKVKYIINYLYTKSVWENWLEQILNSDNDYIHLGLYERDKMLSIELPRKTFAIPFANCIRNVILTDSKFFQEEIDYHFSDDESGINSHEFMLDDES
jgi:hypothetical protein